LGWIFNRETGETRARQMEAGILNHGGRETQSRKQRMEIWGLGRKQAWKAETLTASGGRETHGRDARATTFGPANRRHHPSAHAGMASHHGEEHSTGAIGASVSR